MGGGAIPEPTIGLSPQPRLAGNSGVAEFLAPVPVSATRFVKPRVNFTRFAKSGGRDRKALGRAVRSYVTGASGGAARASRRMGASRAAASAIVDVFARLARDGVQQTLQHYNIDAAFAASPQDAFLALTDVICNDGGPVDEAIARDAWCEVPASIDQFGITDLSAMNDSQRREVFASFVGRTIELRIQNDIGEKGFKVAGTPAEVRQISESLADYVRMATRDEIMGQFPTNLVAVTPPQLQVIGQTVYDRAWTILETFKVDCCTISSSAMDVLTRRSSSRWRRTRPCAGSIL